MFEVSAAATRSKLRILCYHGFSYGDEHEYQPILFMQPGVFRKRMEYLHGAGYRVLALAEGLARLKAGTLPAKAVVLTFDDGWQGIADHAIPVVRQLGFPATVYVTTSYVENRIPVVHVFVKYLLWKTERASLDLARIDSGLARAFSLDSRGQRDAAADAVSQYCDMQLTPAAQREFCLRVAAELGVDTACLAVGAFQMMEKTTLAALDEQGIDIQLHTHRHRPATESDAALAEEIELNRMVLATCTKRRLEHLCYPDGIYSRAQQSCLRRMQITSATTTELGLVDRSTSLYELPRLMDADHLSSLDFAAEISGFAHLQRRFRKRMRRSLIALNPRP